MNLNKSKSGNETRGVLKKRKRKEIDIREIEKIQKKIVPKQQPNNEFTNKKQR